MNDNSSPSDAPDAAPAENAGETAAAFATLTGLAAPEGYSALERYRDFRRVFMGSAEGQRVLREILAWGHLFRPSFLAGGPVDPYRMAIHEGERNMALRLLKTVNTEPPALRPARTSRRETPDA